MNISDLLTKLKKKQANYSNMKEIIDSDFKKLYLNDNIFELAALLSIKEVSKEWEVPRKNGQEKILANGYKWLTLYPIEGNYTVAIIFNEKNEIVEYYFDIAKKVNYKADVPYILDLFLDVVLTKNNEVIFLDEDELDNALKNKVINHDDYELAKKTADNAIKLYNLER